MPKAGVKLLVAALLSIGCQKPPQRIFVAAPPAPAAQSAPPLEPPPPPPVDAAVASAPTLPPATPVVVPQPPPAPVKAKAKRNAPAKKETPTLAASAPEPAPEPDPSVAPAPQLGEVISPQLKHRMDTDIDRAVHNAQMSLQSLTGKSLSARQQVAAAQARSFLRQAVEMRNHDLSSARSLAQRAEVIARDLARSVK
jgi:hypothetical protein